MNKWDERFMQLAETVASWSSCFQENRHVGAVVVKDKRILTTGYTITLSAAPCYAKTAIFTPVSIATVSMAPARSISRWALPSPQAKENLKRSLRYTTRQKSSSSPLAETVGRCFINTARILK